MVNILELELIGFIVGFDGDLGEVVERVELRMIFNFRVWVVGWMLLRLYGMGTSL